MPGTVPESSVSFTGSVPLWFFWYHSMVASLGAVPSALSDQTLPVRRVVDQHHGVAADAVLGGVHEAQHGLPGDDRVEGVAARAQDALGRQGGLRLHGGHRIVRCRE